jgi:hypothetical protein
VHVADQYKVEAVSADGSPFEIVGGSLAGAAMVSLVPTVPHLPRHDVAGLKLVRRFGRGFIRAMGGGLKEYVHCIVCDTCRVYVKVSDGTVLVTPADYELYL